MANDAVVGNTLRVAPTYPSTGDDPVGAVLAAFTCDLVSAVDETLTSYVSGEVDTLVTLDPALATFAEVARDAVLAGGKRLRPTFAYWGWRGAVGANAGLTPVLPALSALELLHAFALVHDDVMDASDTRRGQPTAHRVFATDHHRQGRAGDPKRFGNSAAILVGDLCLVWADRLLARAALPAETLLAVRRCYDQMRIETIAGQYLDVLGETDAANWSAERALRVARYKTAAYTVQRPMHFGAALAGHHQDARLLAAYNRYGLAVGEAFQLCDDLLGVYGDPAVTGKPSGDDLRTGKPTTLLMLAWQLAGRAQRAELRRLTSRVRDGNDDAVEQLTGLVTATGAAARVKRMIADRTADAVAALDTAPMDETARSALTSLAVAATQRRS